MKTYGRAEAYKHIFLISTLVGGEQSGLNLPREREHTLYGRLEGPQSQSGHCGEEKSFYPTRTQTPTLSCPVHSQSLYRVHYTGSYRAQHVHSQNHNFNNE
jgi:hypothetical protein